MDPSEVVNFPKLMKALSIAAGDSTVQQGDWWRFSRRAVDLYSRLPAYERVLVRAEVSDTFAFTFCAPHAIFSNKVIVLLFDTYDSFVVLQSLVHEDWVRLTSSTQGEGLSYVPSYSLDTFPFPSKLASCQGLESAGRSYYEFRTDLMVRNNEGLTKTYNRFHDPNETSPDILTLRELHAAMDRAVLDAYGWQDIQPVYGFGLDYLELDDDAQVSPEAQQVIDSGNLWFPTAEEAQAFAKGIGHTGKKRLSWRYHWPEETRDEVLARLLDLNAQRAKEEQLSGQAAQAKEKKKAKAKPRKAKPKPKGADLFD